jgi:hypothetical protein
VKRIAQMLVSSGAAAGALYASMRVPAGDLRGVLEIVAALWLAVFFGSFWKEIN